MDKTPRKTKRKKHQSKKKTATRKKQQSREKKAVKVTIYVLEEDLALMREGARCARLSRSRYLATLTFRERKHPKLFGLDQTL